MKYSVFSLLRQSLSGHKNWPAAWRDPEPKPSYDIVIVGGGGHGLATAYYLAKEYGLKNIAVLEKGWLGSGNIGRNTTIIRSNYMLPGNNPFYEFSMKLWEGLEQDFNFNAMVSQRGVLNLCHTDPQRDAFARRGNAMRIDGVDAELLVELQALGELGEAQRRFVLVGQRAATGRAEPGSGLVLHPIVVAQGVGADVVDVALREGAGSVGYTIAKALHELDVGSLTLLPFDLVVVDEAAMVGTRTLARLLDLLLGFALGLGFRS